MNKSIYLVLELRGGSVLYGVDQSTCIVGWAETEEEAKNIARTTPISICPSYINDEEYNETKPAEVLKEERVEKEYNICLRDGNASILRQILEISSVPKTILVDRALYVE